MAAEDADRPSALERFWRSQLTRTLAARLGAMIPVLILLSIFTFLLMQIMPGNSAGGILGTNATDEQLAALEEELGLNDPMPVRYWRWITGVLTGDLGQSTLYGEPVTSYFADRLPVTLELGVLSLVVALALSIPVALIAARRPRGIIDRISMAISMVGLAVPQFVMALAAIIIFSVTLGWLPSIGYVPLSDSLWGNIESMILPTFAAGLGSFCGFTRFLRADLEEQMVSGDYVLTARAKGASPWRLLSRHALRNSILGFTTLVGLHVATVVSGSVVMEQIFALPGIGQGLLKAIHARDAPVVQATVLLVAVAVVLANFLTDPAYAVIDPRIRDGSDTD